MAQNKAKMISLEEGGFAIFLVLLAFACIIVAGKTFDQVMAFHAGIGALFAAVSVFLIFKNYFDDGGEVIPAEIDGKPNYNIGPIKFGAVAAMFWRARNARRIDQVIADRTYGAIAIAFRPGPCNISCLTLKTVCCDKLIVAWKEPGVERESRANFIACLCH